MATPMTGTYSLASIDDLKPLIADTPLGDASLNLKLASGQVQTAAHLSTALPVEFTFHAGADLFVVALNGKSGDDESGVVGASAADTPAGAFEPLLRFGTNAGWLKYVAKADVKADVGADNGTIAFVGSAGAQIAMADYHRHALADRLRAIVIADLAQLRSAMSPNHVGALPDGDALVFETDGQLTASIDIEWSDVFTSEISGLARLIKAVAPITIETTLGATCSVAVTVDDSFVVAFARREGKLLVAVRKNDVRKLDASGSVSVKAVVASAKSIEAVLDRVVAGLLGTATDRLQQLLDHLATGALSADDSGLAAAIVDRLKLAATSEIQSAVATLKARAHDAVASIVESKVEASFAYEYHRVASDVSVFEAEIVSLSDGLHRDLVTGQLGAAFGRPPSEIRVAKFLNERTQTVSRAWGFTLGLNKWKLFGTDRREATLVERADRVAGTVSRSYIGSGGYERSRLSWTVDFAADMPHASAAPLVGDYTFGLHLAVVRDAQTFTPRDLDEALDFAVLWSICPESAIAAVRQQLASAINQQAEWSFQLRVNDEAWRVMCRMLGSMIPRDFAVAAAAALDPAALPSVAQRRSMYGPLWQRVLADEGSCNAETVRLSADTLVSEPALAGRERMAATALAGFDLATVAGTVRADTNWFDDCARFSRGCRQLAGAIAVPTPDRGQVADTYRLMVGFWSESHYVRTLGAALVDCARAAGEFKGVERTLSLKAKTALVVSSNQF